MKLFIATIATAIALVFSAQAADTAKISNVHLCCNSCVTGVEKAVSAVPGVKATCDKDAGTIELSGANKADLQKATDALTAAGYFGTSTDVKLDASTGAPDGQVQKLTISGLHLCCAKCVKSVDKAVMGVSGVTSQNAVKGAKTFDITGNFSAKEVFASLQKEGLTGKVK
jgi:copper chaperone CopZ